MSDEDARSHRSARSDRSRSPLKAIPYQHASNGTPPRRVVLPGESDPTAPSSSPSQSNRASQLSTVTLPSGGINSPPRRPRSSPSPRAIDHASLLSNEIKRDSGFATSISPSSAAGSGSGGGGLALSTCSPSRLSSSTTTGGVAQESSLPTIIVHDEEGNGSNNKHDATEAMEPSRSSMASQPTSSGTVPSHIAQSASPSPAMRSGSFEGLPSELPSGKLENIDLEDLASDKVGFSKRGSLLFGGKKMKAILDEAERAPVRRSEEAAASSISLPVPRKARHDAEDADRLSVVGLQAARSKAEARAQQAVPPGARALSAEELSFSLRVRSMYEHGDERAPEWINKLTAGSATRSRTVSPARDTPTPPSAGTPPLSVDKKRVRRPSASPRHSYYAKEATELAGGIEDWENVDGHDIDRYGFINENRAFSRDSETSGRQEGLHRVATSLRAEADQPRRERKLRRRVSNARSSRSVPPRPTSRVSTVGKSAGSVRSMHSHASTSRTSVFRSREKRLLTEASDMLTLPPGLADIAEHEDAGRTASMLKQREWAREEKWQKMARPIRDRNPGAQAGVGGGMRFEFDTHDPKVINRTWKGIPDRWRAMAWHSFLSTSARKRQSAASDEELIGQFHKLQPVSSADDAQIDVDVPRTISKHIMFRRRYRGGQRLLFRVLHAVSLYFPGTGYVQGMASLAATLLCYFDEERAFVMMARLWQLRGLEQLFQPGFDGLMSALQDFEERWLAGGDVARKLNELGVASTAYGTRWYLTLFSMSVPFPAQLRIWDVFMLLGDEIPAAHATNATSKSVFGGADMDVLHATGAALVDATREIILDSDFENAMKVLTSFIPIKDEDLLMRVARAEWKMKKAKKG